MSESGVHGSWFSTGLSGMRRLWVRAVPQPVAKRPVRLTAENTPSIRQSSLSERFGCLLLAFCLLGGWAQPARGQLANPATTNNTGGLVFANGYADLNDDGQVNVLDVVRITHHLNGIRSLPAALIPRADITQAGRITAGDRAIMVDVILVRRTKPTDDFDFDELSNQEELRRGTNPFEPDSDHDGVWDGMEVADNTDPLDSRSHGRAIFMAQPSTAILSALPEGPVPATAGPVWASPNVQVTFAALDGAIGTPATTANPPVKVALPAIESAGGQALTLAQPPVALIHRESEPLSLSSTNTVTSPNPATQANLPYENLPTTSKPALSEARPDRSAYPRPAHVHCPDARPPQSDRPKL